MDEWRQLYISGTASIVGHETKHLDDVAAQLDETLVNLDAIIEQANERYELGCKGVSDLQLIRVYVRDPENHELVTRLLEERFGSELRYQLVQGDICRTDLLLEIEGMYAHCQ